MSNPINSAIQPQLQQTITSTGLVTIPAGVTQVWAKLIGGGGGGSTPSTSSGSGSGGYGGGSGYVTYGLIPISGSTSPSQLYAVIGAGGLADQNGGTTQIANLSAPGGNSQTASGNTNGGSAGGAPEQSGGSYGASTSAGTGSGNLESPGGGSGGGNWSSTNISNKPGGAAALNGGIGGYGGNIRFGNIIPGTSGGNGNTYGAGGGGGGGNFVSVSTVQGFQLGWVQYQDTGSYQCIGLAIYLTSVPSQLAVGDYFQVSGAQSNWNSLNFSGIVSQISGNWVVATSTFSMPYLSSGVTGSMDYYEVNNTPGYTQGSNNYWGNIPYYNTKGGSIVGYNSLYYQAEESMFASGGPSAGNFTFVAAGSSFSTSGSGGNGVIYLYY